MVNKDKRQEIAELDENIVLFGGEDIPFGQAYDNSIIGIDNWGRAVYDMDLMIEEYMKDNDCSYEDALDWIDYNTLGVLSPYDSTHPIVITHKMIDL